jgi:SAM-dependent methyltransferase
MTKMAGARAELFLISLLVLFLELVCIRWFPSHVLFLTFFTNTVLLACVLGISVGCLAANRRLDFLPWTPLLLIVALGGAHLVEYQRQLSNSIVDVGNQSSPQMVFFGVEYQPRDPSTFVIPIEALCGFFFLALALVMVGPSQHMGRALAKLPNRVESYTINILGSIAGIVLFAACSWWELAPLWWFAIVLGGLGYFLTPHDRVRGLALAVGPGLVLLLASTQGFTPNATPGGKQEYWSPYYRIHYDPDPKLITVNLIGHQQMVSRQSPFPAYSLPHLLNRDAGQKPFGQVLIIGAGSGNDVSRALAWGAGRVDAVEIDPVIYRLGRHHPDHPYADPRVLIHLNDGRNYLKSSKKQYDLIVYALVDSLVLHSSYSNIRLESYLFTKQAMDDVRKRLRPNGVFVMYNYFRQGWIVSRLQNALKESFGDSALVLNLPSRDTLEADQTLGGDFTVLFAGATGPLRDAFARQPEYWLRGGRAPDSQMLNGFEYPLPSEREGWRALPAEERASSLWQQYRLTTVIASNEPLRLATDDWPFLYLRQPMVPGLSLRGGAIMGTIALLLLAPFLKRARSVNMPETTAPVDTVGALAQMFFLGAGFMLVETKAVVHMALLFGGTWVVNSVVIFAVLVMILFANLFVLAARPTRLGPYYAGLLVSLVISALVPMDYFLGMDRTTQIVGSSLLAFVPILFAGVIFAVSFGRAAEPERAFGANIAGAMFGGLAEYSSMLLGFQYLLFVAVALYMFSFVSMRLGPRRESS